MERAVVEIYQRRGVLSGGDRSRNHNDTDVGESRVIPPILRRDASCSRTFAHSTLQADAFASHRSDARNSPRSRIRRSRNEFIFSTGYTRGIPTILLECISAGCDRVFFIITSVCFRIGRVQIIYPLIKENLCALVDDFNPRSTYRCFVIIEYPTYSEKTKQKDSLTERLRFLSRDCSIFCY